MAHGPPSSIRVLFVEDSFDDVELIRLELARHGFNVQPRVTETRSDFVTAIREGTWDVVLSDHSMKGFGSTDALRLLREYDADTPFIIVSGTIGEDSAVEAMRAGAHDAVPRPLVAPLRSRRGTQGGSWAPPSASISR